MPQETDWTFRPVEDRQMAPKDTIIIYLAAEFERYWPERIRTKASSAFLSPEQPRAGDPLLYAAQKAIGPRQLTKEETRDSYLDFLEHFFSLAHEQTNRTAKMALINADWRDFQNRPARDEIRGHSILINDYLRILNKAGWQETHIIQAPMSSERFEANVVAAMQKKRILGVTSRYVIIAKKKGETGNALVPK